MDDAVGQPLQPESEKTINAEQATWKTPPGFEVSETAPLAQKAATQESSQGASPQLTTYAQAIPATTLSTRPVVPKSQRFVKIVIVVLGLFVLVVFILIGLVFADDKGLVKTGISPFLKFMPLSQIWGGLSANPKTASAQTARALELQPGFSYSGSFTGYSATSQTAINKNCITASIITCPIDPLSQDVQFAIKVYGTNYNLETILNDSGVNVKTEHRHVDSVTYTSGLFGATDSEGSGGDVWQKTDQATLITVSAVRDRFGALLNSSSFIGNERVGAHDTYHFKSTISGKDIPFWSTSAAPVDSINWTDSHGSLDTWVSRKTHLPIKIAISLTSPDKKTIAIDASYIGVYSQEITAPVNVIDSTISADQTRKADLKKISAALQKYYTEKGVFPTTTGIEHLDQSSSALGAALVPTYLSVLPQDPTGGHYYGYTSNGSVYELSAVLDDKVDPEGVVTGSVTLYVVKNTLN